MYYQNLEATTRLPMGYLICKSIQQIRATNGLFNLYIPTQIYGKPDDRRVLSKFGRGLVHELWRQEEKEKGKGNTIWQGTCTFRNGASIRSALYNVDTHP